MLVPRLFADRQEHRALSVPHRAGVGVLHAVGDGGQLVEANGATLGVAHDDGPKLVDRLHPPHHSQGEIVAAGVYSASGEGEVLRVDGPGHLQRGDAQGLGA